MAETNKTWKIKIKPKHIFINFDENYKSYKYLTNLPNIQILQKKPCVCACWCCLCVRLKWKWHCVTSSLILIVVLVTRWWLLKSNEKEKRENKRKKVKKKRRKNQNKRTHKFIFVAQAFNDSGASFKTYFIIFSRQEWTIGRTNNANKNEIDLFSKLSQKKNFLLRVTKKKYIKNWFLLYYTTNT